MVEMYDQEGKTARANQGDQYAWGTPKGNDQTLSFRECAGEPTCRRTTPTDGRVGRSSSEAGAQGGRTGSTEQRLEGLFVASESSPRTKAGQDTVRWIFAPSSTATTNRDLWTLREAKTLELLQVLPTGRFCSQNQGGQNRCNSWPLGRYPPATKSQRKTRKRKGPTGDEGDEEDRVRTILCDVKGIDPLSQHSGRELAIWTLLKVT